MEEYVKTIKELHLKDKKKRWRALGTLKGKSAEGLLTEIDTSIDTRPVRLLQCIFEHKGVAYILTAAAETKEMALYTPLFLEAFKSFTITPDLLESIPETSRQNSLKAKLETLKANPELRKGFEKKFVKEYGDMGLHWQLLILKQEYNL